MNVFNVKKSAFGHLAARLSDASSHRAIDAEGSVVV